MRVGGGKKPVRGKKPDTSAVSKMRGRGMRFGPKSEKQRAILSVAKTIRAQRELEPGARVVVEVGGKSYAVRGNIIYKMPK